MDKKCTGGHITNQGGDKMAYLGHFRGKEVLEKGHNVGAPNRPQPGPKMSTDTGYQPPKVAPRSRVKEASMAVKEAKKTGGDVAAAKAARKTAVGERKEAYKEFGAAKAAFKEKGYGGGRSKALKEAKSNLQQNYAGSFKNYQAEQKRKAEGGGGFLGGIMGGAKKALGMASGDLRNARHAVRKAMKPAGAARSIGSFKKP